MCTLAMNLLNVANCLAKTPSLACALSFDDAIKYIELVRCLKPTIVLLQPSSRTMPPDTLSYSNHDFLKVCLRSTDEVAKLAWATLRDLAWNESDHVYCHGNDASMHIKYAPLFLNHGLSRGISMLILPIGTLKLTTNQAYIIWYRLHMSVLMLNVESHWSLIRMRCAIGN